VPDFLRLVTIEVARAGPIRLDSSWLSSINSAVPLLSSDPNPRQYDRFSDVMKDVIDARVWLGIHFRFADTEARSQGRRAASEAFRNILEPIRNKK
jgi:hypothetical protein